MASLLSPMSSALTWRTSRRKHQIRQSLRPLCYINETFVIWFHRHKKAAVFLHHLNRVHRSIQLTLESERNCNLSFLDEGVCRRHVGSLGDLVYGKPTHTSLYPHDTVHHPCSKKQAVLTLVHRAKLVCDPEGLQELSSTWSLSVNAAGEIFVGCCV